MSTSIWQPSKFIAKNNLASLSTSTSDNSLTKGSCNSWSTSKNSEWTASKNGHHYPCENCWQWPPAEKKKEDICRILHHAPQPTTQWVNGLNWTELYHITREKWAKACQHVKESDELWWTKDSIQPPECAILVFSSTCPNLTTPTAKRLAVRGRHQPVRI